MNRAAPHPATAAAPRRTSRKLLASASAVIVLTAIAWLAWDAPRPGAGVVKPIAIAAFSDGFRVELQRAVLGTQLDCVSEESRGLLSVVATNSRSNTYSFGYLKLKTLEENDHFKSATLSRDDDAPALFLMFRAFAADGSRFVGDGLSSKGETWRVKRENTWFDRVEDEGEMPEVDPLFEVEDGAGGWRVMDGPLFPDTLDARGMAMAPVFPRRTANLKLRVQHQGCAPVVLEIPNPGHKPAFPKLIPEPQPITKQGGEFAVTTSVDPLDDEPGYEVYDKIEAPGLPKYAYDLKSKVTDACGNVLPDRPSLLPLPGEKLATVSVEVSRNETFYPWRASEVLFVAEGVFGAPGSLPSATITEDGKRNGFTSVKFTPPAKDASTGGNNPPEMPFDLLGETTAVHWAAFSGAHDASRAVVFLSGDRSEGINSSGGSGRSESGGKVSFEIGMRWEGPQTPGQKFRIAIPRPMPSHTLDFIVEFPPSR